MKWNHPAARKFKKALNTPEYCPMATDGEHEWHNIVDAEEKILFTSCILCGRRTT